MIDANLAHLIERAPARTILRPLRPHRTTGRLTLSRRVGEVIVISLPEGDVRMIVQSIGSGTIRLAFEAPRSVPIVRQEIHAAQKEEGR